MKKLLLLIVILTCGIEYTNGIASNNLVILDYQTLMIEYWTKPPVDNSPEFIIYTSSDSIDEYFLDNLKVNIDILRDFKIYKTNFWRKGYSKLTYGCTRHIKQVAPSVYYEYLESPLLYIVDGQHISTREDKLIFSGKKFEDYEFIEFLNKYNGRKRYGEPGRNGVVILESKQEK